MKKGQILEGYIERVDFPNKGFAVVEDEEKKVIVKNTVPEQKVRFAVNKIRKGQAEGRLLEILEHSPEECQPACPHFGVCGGCTYQNLPYEKQVEMKEAQIHAMMDAAVDGDYIWEGVKESPVREAYRNKMEFSFGDEVKDVIPYAIPLSVIFLPLLSCRIRFSACPVTAPFVCHRDRNASSSPQNPSGSVWTQGTPSLLYKCGPASNPAP